MRISCFRWSTWLLRKSGRDQGNAGQTYKSNGEVMLTKPNPTRRKTKVENWLNAQKCLPTGSENKDSHSKDRHLENWGRCLSLYPTFLGCGEGDQLLYVSLSFISFLSDPSPIILSTLVTSLTNSCCWNLNDVTLSFWRYQIKIIS